MEMKQKVFKMRIPKCLALFLQKTNTGERNTNLFIAINHLRYFNKKKSRKKILNMSLELNKQITNPLSESEVNNIVKHVISKNYGSSCKKHFSHFCKRCNVGTRKRPYKDFKKNYWKTIKRDNTIVRRLTNGACLYSWDIVDTVPLSPEKEKLIKELRESKGINPIIDTVLTLRGIKIGDEALEEWNTYRNK